LKQELGGVIFMQARN